MKREENVLVMGGSFNPPTIAHLRLFQAALDALNAELGYLAPVSHAYLKRKLVRAGCGHMCIPVAARLEMLRAMIAGDARIRIYEGELDQPFAITLCTMEAVQALHPQARIWFVLGEDKLELMEQLARKYDFLRRFGIVVFARGGDLEEAIARSPELSGCRESIAIVPPPQGIEGVSSTAVRAHLFDADAVADMLHPAVLPLVKRLRESDYPEEIIEFKGEWAFLANACPTAVEYQGIVYPSAESAFQASRSDDIAVRKRFAAIRPDSARQKGSQIATVPGWEARRADILSEITRLKFEQNPELREKLLNTGNRRLINGGRGKKDTFLGVNITTWEGENRLGAMLMELRKTMKEERDS